MKTVAIIQARMGASRLPGKVLSRLGGEVVLGWVVRAAQAALGIDAVCIATSTDARDDAIVRWAGQNKVVVHRGSEHDVLARYADAAKASGAEVVVRLTADCPFLDPQIIAQTVRLRAVTGAAYASNIDPPTWPDGLDCEVFTVEALLAAATEATRPSDREHVTPFIRNNRARFPAETLTAPLPGLAGERWTLDTPTDLAFLGAVAERLKAGRPPSFLEVLAVLDREPKLREINGDEQRNAGFAKSVSAEKLDTSRSFGRSQHMLDRAEQVIPLGSQTFSKSRIQLPPGAAPLFVTHGSGGRVFDVDGNEYVDLINALLPNVLGYRDADVDLAIRRQLTRGISFSLPTDLEMRVGRAAGYARALRRDGSLWQERHRRHLGGDPLWRGRDAAGSHLAVRLSRLARLVYRRNDPQSRRSGRGLGAVAHVPYGDLAAVEAQFAGASGLNSRPSSLSRPVPPNRRRAICKA